LTGFSFNPSRTLAAAFVFGSFHQVPFLSCPSQIAALNVVTGLDLRACHLGRWCCCGPHFRARFFQGAQLIVLALVIFYEAYSYLAVKFSFLSIAYRFSQAVVKLKQLAAVLPAPLNVYPRKVG
jgi:hypothetical protein